MLLQSKLLKFWQHNIVQNKPILLTLEWSKTCREALYSTAQLLFIKWHVLGKCLYQLISFCEHTDWSHVGIQYLQEKHKQFQHVIRAFNFLIEYAIIIRSRSTPTWMGLRLAVLYIHREVVYIYIYISALQWFPKAIASSHNILYYVAATTQLAIYSYRDTY